MLVAQADGRQFEDIFISVLYQSAPFFQPVDLSSPQPLAERRRRQGQRATYFADHLPPHSDYNNHSSTAVILLLTPTKGTEYSCPRPLTRIRPRESRIPKHAPTQRYEALLAQRSHHKRQAPGVRCGGTSSPRLQGSKGVAMAGATIYGAEIDNVSSNFHPGDLHSIGYLYDRPAKRRLEWSRHRDIPSLGGGEVNVLGASVRRTDIHTDMRISRLLRVICTDVSGRKVGKKKKVGSWKKEGGKRGRTCFDRTCTDGAKMASPRPPSERLVGTTTYRRHPTPLPPGKAPQKKRFEIACKRNIRSEDPVPSHAFTC
ncbi:hypothetical protein BDV96DRAFT_603711 [Lophiotrema nucula]|uniref:Uncharacterized protein n=1 Tax=Lophiotrema nucula TaxID=690887 RepID=A0A6A5YUF4_9PLEO|nr:hypothetical protein BDV96DRAFT_603711 [Lophiotrema nucula]